MPTPVITVDDVVVSESEGFVEFVVRLSEPAAGAVSVNYATANASAGGTDFTAVSGTLNFAAGETMMVVRVNLLGDSVQEAFENFSLTLSSASNAIIGRNVATATIVDNDAPAGTPTVSVSDFVVDEAHGQATFTVLLDRPSTTAVTMNFATQNGTALAGSDYVATSGTLSFAPGQTSMTVSVGLLNDATAEGPETFNLVLSNLNGAATADTTGTAIIAANDGPAVGSPVITVDDVVVGEGQAYVDFVVRLSAPGTGNVSVNYTTANVTAVSIFNSGNNDYVGQNGTLVFTPGETVQVVRISLTDGTTPEGFETFRLDLSGASGGVIGRTSASATIVDNDGAAGTPTVSVSDLVVDESHGLASFVVTLDRPSTTTVTMDYATQGASATAGSDFVAAGGTLNFAPGQVSQTVFVTLLNDATAEDAEAFNLVLSNLDGAVTADPNGTALIGANDAPTAGTPVLTVDDIVVGESQDYVEFVVRLNAPSAANVSVNFTTVNDTAVSVFSSGNNDYVGLSGTLIFAPGETVQIVRISLTDGITPEDFENFSLSLSGASGAVIGRNVATGTLVDNDAVTGTPNVAVTDFIVDEAHGVASFVVTLDRPSSTAVTMGFATQDVTAVAGSDYVATSGTLNFAPGQVSQTVFVTLLNDALPENAEAFNLVLSNVVGAAAADPAGTAIIAANDGPTVGTPLLSVDDVTIGEGQGWVDFVVRLSAPSAANVSVNYTTQNETAVSIFSSGINDYVGQSGSLVFAAGETVQIVRISLTDGLTAEGLENFNLLLSGATGAAVGRGIATATIVDNDATTGTPIAAVSGLVVDESNGLASFVVTLDRPSNAPVSMSFATQDGSAQAGADYVATTGTLQFAPGQTSATVFVTLLDDGTAEGAESFNLVLSGVTGATTADPVGTLFIAPSDGPTVGTPTISVDDATVGEGQGYIDFVIRLSAPSAANVTVVYTTANATALSTASSGNNDYVGQSGSLVFAAGETVQTVRIALTDGVTAENFENFNLVLSSATNGVIGHGTATATIVDNDATTGTPVVSIGDVHVDETAGLMHFFVILDRPSAVPVTMNFATADGTATAGQDYIATTGTLEFRPGETVQEVIVSLINDGVTEPAEAFSLVLSNVGSGTPGDPVGTGVIAASDAATAGSPVISVGSTIVGENAQFVEFLVHLDAPSIGQVRVNYTTANGTALSTATSSNNDYVGQSGTLIFAPGQTELVVRVTLTQNTLVETDETFTLALSSPVGGTLSPDASTATATIWDDDTNPVLAEGLSDDTYELTTGNERINDTGGTDTVVIGLTYTLQDNLENLTLTGSADIDGTGNAADNVLIGNTGVNLLTGLGGNDTLDGGGADTLVGGDGNDTYVIDNTGVTVTESAGAGTGTDLVLSSIGYTLGANLENLTLTGTGNINGTGNTLANVITGNAGNNTLSGGGGEDTLVGGAGNDTYVVDSAGDVVTEGVNQGTDLVQANITYTLGANLENLTLTGGGNLNGTGNAGANVLTGNSGNNTLDGAAGADAMAGGAGNDTYVVDDAGDTVTESANQGTDLVQAGVSFTLGANVENLTLIGTGSIDGTGNALANVLTGNGGNNTLDGGAGADAMAGGAGNDTYVVDDPGDAVTENANQGTDLVQAGVSFTLGANVENLTLTGTGSIDGTGNTLANAIIGNAGNNTLDGGGGADAMAGGAGNDIYVVDDAGDTVTEGANQGTDLVRSGFSFTLGANIENLTLTGTGNIDGTGNALVNALTGNTGSNTLDGGAGADTMAGGAGNDTYVVDDAGDVVTESAGNGTDLVRSSVTFTLGANLENLTLTGIGNVDGTGNALANALTGNAGNNTLDGGAGIDTMAGGAGNDTYVVDVAGDTVTESAGNGTDLVRSGVTFALSDNVENLALTGTGNIDGTGNALANLLTGNSGNNVLDGGAGADTMTGGAGNDTYVVDVAGDAVTEAAGEGSDLVQAGISYVLGANLENLTLTGTGDLDGTGNTLANVLTGNAGDNTLDGGSGADTMAGGAGNDTYVVDVAGDVVTEGASQGTDLVQAGVSFTLGANVENLTLTGSGDIDATGNASANVLTGNAGSNVLDGRAGADTMVGGAGNDTYVVDNAGDVVTEALNRGVDLVQASVSYTLATNLENLTLTGVDDIDATGNAAANALTGNAGDNTLDGGAGLDTMAGGAGNDTYVVDVAGDVVTEVPGGGTDLVMAGATYTLGANVENLTLTGTGNLDGTGNALANVLTGNSGNNTLDGAAGADTMAGGAGNDTYEVDDAGDLVTESASQGVDLVLAGVTYTLGANLENLTLTGTGNLDGTGSALANVLTGNSGSNTLDGGAGADTLAGGAGNDIYVVDDAGDTVTEGLDAGIDLVRAGVSFTLGANLENLTLTGTGNIDAAGNTLANILTGNSGNNLLNGGAGADTMVGGAGDDTYTVDNAGDVVTELDAGGTDLVRSSVNYTLGVNVEDLTLFGSGALDGTGNALANHLTGNGSANVLTGLKGNDTLDGGGGADTLAGGIGNDTYIVDAADTILENADEGTDSVQAGFSYTLGANLENLTLTGAAAINGTGNDLDNRITGNKGANILDGGTGADTLVGLGGSDTYIVNNVADAVIERANGGIDTVLASVSYTLATQVDNLTLTGNAAIDATGNALANVLTGNSSANVLTGGGGGDTFFGGGGDDTIDAGGSADKDVIKYGAVLSGTDTATNGSDTILNFDGNPTGGQDKIDLDALFDSLGFSSADRAAGAGFTVVGNQLFVDLDNNNATGANGGFEYLLATVTPVSGVFDNPDVIAGTP